MVQILVGLFFILMMIGIVGGWVMNIVWLFGQDLVWNMEQVLSVLGIVMAPLGAVMGWLH